MAWLTSDAVYDTFLAIGLLIALFIFLSSLHSIAPYGRFGEESAGVKLNPKLGWILMELPAPLFFVIFYFLGPNWAEPVPLLFLAIWLIHYLNRGLIGPLLMRVQPGHRSTFNFQVVILGWVVVALHGYLNGTWITTHAGYLTSVDWLTSGWFITGIVIYLVSLIFNIHSDAVLRGLRSKNPSPDEPRYRIPYGGLFRWVTCPQYLTEIGCWIGFTLFTLSPGGVFITLVTAANLVPRALATHRWYHEKFDDYPPSRKAIIPFVL